MATIDFTGNMQDLSTDVGFQFKFFCEHCGSGFMSTFQRNDLGIAGELLRGASSFLGSAFGQAADSAYHVQRAVGGVQHDQAVREAVAEIRPLFNQCKKCGDWMCKEVCWNPQAGMCKNCAPLAEELETSARAQFAGSSIQNDLNLEEEERLRARDQQRTCPHCGADTGGKKFCGECGQATGAAARVCTQCGARANPGVKFCQDCGTRLG